MRRAAALFTVLVLGACSPAPARQNATAAHPSVVSLNPCTDAILAEVAGPEQILALSNFSRDPASSSMDVAVARRFPAISGTVEEVATLRPDMVVAGTYLAPATRAAIKRLGVRLVEVPIAASIADSKAQVARLGALVGHPDRAGALNARIDAALASAAPPPGKPATSAVVWQSGGIVAGDETLIADLLRHTGFANFSGMRGLRQAEHLPLERLLADPPQVILAAGNTLSQEDRMLSHPVLAHLNGTRRERLAPSLVWCGGPTIVRAAARLAAIRNGL